MGEEPSGKAEGLVTPGGMCDMPPCRAGHVCKPKPGLQVAGCTEHMSAPMERVSQPVAAAVHRLFQRSWEGPL